MSRFKTAFISLAAVLSLAIGFATSVSATETRNYGDSPIIRGGVMTADELKQKYSANERGTQAIFSHYGITATDIANSATAKIGYLYTDGTIKVDGKTVATNAVMAGRLIGVGGTKVSIGDWTVYEGAERITQTFSVYVFNDQNGNFKAAIARICGNPITATPVKKPVYSCDALSANKISRLEYEFTTQANAADGAIIESYNYDFGDGTKTAGGATIRHTYKKAGTYNVTTTLKVKVDGTTKDVTGNCKTTITIEPEPIKVCDLTSKTIITINKDDFDATKHTEDMAECEDIYVCVIDSKKTVTITKREFEDNKQLYTTDMSVCAPKPKPEPEKPTPPIVLPETGIADILSGGVGAGAMTLASYYYYASRRF